MNVKSYSNADVDAFKILLNQDLANGFKPTLAICFCEATLDFKSLSSFLILNNIDTIGTTTCGEIYDDTWQEGTISILLLELDKSAYHIELVSFEEGQDVAARKIAQVASKKFSRPALLTYASSVGANGDLIVRSYKEILEPKTPIFGGLAGDNFKNKEFTVFYNNTFENDGLVALILNGEKLRVEGKAFSGWEALGKTHVVTKANGNVLYEIDETSALELFIEYFGLEKANESDGEKMELIPGIYPLKVISKNHEEKMRSPLYYDRENSALILGGELEVGDHVKFCPMPDIDTILNTVAFFESYAETHPHVDAVIINSCASRKFAFGPLMGKEIKEIYDIWKAPTAGLMAMGEIGRGVTESECNFHNVTCSLVSLTQIS